MLKRLPFFGFGVTLSMDSRSNRNREVVNYDESGVPDEQHLLVVRVTGKQAADTQGALEEYLEGRHYEQLFAWPEQGLMVYLVGSR